MRVVGRDSERLPAEAAAVDGLSKVELVIARAILAEVAPARLAGIKREGARRDEDALRTSRGGLGHERI
jgi:hypothetical protein